jgi:hypothetical protein
VNGGDEKPCPISLTARHFVELGSAPRRHLLSGPKQRRQSRLRPCEDCRYEQGLAEERGGRSTGSFPARRAKHRCRAYGACRQLRKRSPAYLAGLSNAVPRLQGYSATRPGDMGSHARASPSGLSLHLEGEVASETQSARCWRGIPDRCYARGSAKDRLRCPFVAGCVESPPAGRAIAGTPATARLAEQEQATHHRTDRGRPWPRYRGSSSWT